MKKQKVDLDTLVKEVCKMGCKISHIEDPKAIEFIDKIVTVYQEAPENGKPCLERVVELLQKYWDIDIKRRALSEHVRGKCSCQKPKK